MNRIRMAMANHVWSLFEDDKVYLAIWREEIEICSSLPVSPIPFIMPDASGNETSLYLIWSISPPNVVCGVPWWQCCMKHRHHIAFLVEGSLRSGHQEKCVRFSEFYHTQYHPTKKSCSGINHSTHGLPVFAIKHVFSSPKSWDLYEIFKDHNSTNIRITKTALKNHKMLSQQILSGILIYSDLQKQQTSLMIIIKSYKSTNGKWNTIFATIHHHTHHFSRTCHPIAKQA